MSSARYKEESSSSKGRHAKMHVGHSLTSCSEGSPEDYEKQSGDDDDLVHPRQVRRVLQGTASPNRADTCTPSSISLCLSLCICLSHFLN